MNKLLTAIIVIVILAGVYAGLAAWKKWWPFKASKTPTSPKPPVSPGSVVTGGSCKLTADCAAGPMGSTSQPGACVDGTCMYLVGTSSSGRNNAKGLAAFCHNSIECNGGYRCVSNRDAETIHKIGNGGDCAKGNAYGTFTLK